MRGAGAGDGDGPSPRNRDRGIRGEERGETKEQADDRETHRLGAARGRPRRESVVFGKRPDAERARRGGGGGGADTRRGFRRNLRELPVGSELGVSPSSATKWKVFVIHVKISFPRRRVRRWPG